MELKQFIIEVLSDITKAVKESQHSLREDGTKISPDLVKNIQGEICINDKVSYVDFDIAVSDTDKKGGGVGIGVVNVLSLGGKMENEVTSKTISRIKFSIPVVYPIQRK